MHKLYLSSYKTFTKMPTAIKEHKMLLIIARKLIKNSIYLLIIKIGNILETSYQIFDLISIGNFPAKQNFPFSNFPCTALTVCH